MGTLTLLADAKAARIERNPVEIYLSGLSATGRRSMAQKLKTVAGILGYMDAQSVVWGKLRFDHAVAIRSSLSDGGLAPATVNATLAALRGVAKVAWSLNLLHGDDYNRIAAVKGLRSSRLPSGRALTVGEVTALFDACYADKTAAGRRDAAILALLLGAGLRRAECAALSLSDYSRESADITVHGKGDKQRLMPLGNTADLALRDWLTVRGDGPGALLCRVGKNGKVELSPISAQAIYAALTKRGKAARVARFSPHDLRKTYASGLIDLSGDISTVSRLLGHASVDTTAIYDRRGEAAKRKVAEGCHLPYRRPAGL
jgi:site-specific recombinase XerC